GASTTNFNHQDFIDLTPPLLIGPATQMSAAKKSSLVIICSEVGGSRMRNVDGNHRNARLEEFLGDRRRNGLVRFEFDHQIDFLTSEMVCIAKRYLRIVAIVNDDQFKMKRLRSAQQTGFHLLGKRRRLALSSIGDTIPSRGTQIRAEAILIFADLLNKTAHVQRVQHPEAHALVEACA